jgi:peptidoglycan/LPS O-acetylase OafA/YrhL
MSSLRLELPAPVTGRLRAVDELKGVAIILVVLYHAGGVLVWNNLFHFDLGVDLFVILSGLGLGFGSHYGSAGAFLARRFIRVLPGYWFVLTGFWIANTRLLGSHYAGANLWIHYLGVQGWCGDGYGFAINDSFWYISLILALYVAYCPVHAWLDFPDRVLLAGAAVTALVVFVFAVSPGYSELMGHLALRIPGFFFGLLAGRFLRAGRIEFRLGPVLVFGLTLLFYLSWTQDLVPATAVIGLSLIGAYLFAVRPLVPSPLARPMTGVLKFLGDHSLEIFLIHQPLIREYNFYCYRQWFHDGAPTPGRLLLGIGAGLAVTLALSVALHRLLLQIPLPFPPSRRPEPAAG